MKKSNALYPSILLIGLFCTLSIFARAQVSAAKQTASQGASDAIKGFFKKKDKNPKPDTTTAPAGTGTGTGTATGTAASGSAGAGANGSAGAPISLKTYSNYDFVPGDQVIFDDNFNDDADGEFPAHWGLEKGQAIINKVSGVPAFCLTQGNYVEVTPRLKTKDDYLPDNFTIEFDFFPTDGASNPGLLFGNGDNKTGFLFFGKDVSSSYFPKDFSANYPGDNDHFNGKWHHAAMIRKGNQIKCYLDQYRVLVMPDVSGIKLTRVEVGGIGGMEHPIVFRNFHIAAGGNMNLIGKKFTDNKIVTHGINFDVDKATIQPESMGTLNMVVAVMKDNPDIKFEIDGHTDNSGTAAHNLDLSQQRADAVKTQLVGMGIDASRLSTKGFGDTKPISDNGTSEGKANNRRVEFVKTVS